MATAISNTAIQLKKSGSSGNTPASLTHGEVAINYADGKLYYKNWLDNIDFISNQDTFGTVNANSTLIFASSPTDVLSINPGQGVRVAGNSSSKSVTLSVDESGLSSASYANAAFIQANAAYTLANTIAAGSVDVYARSHANAAYDLAVAAIPSANGSANNLTVGTQLSIYAPIKLGNTNYTDVGQIDSITYTTSNTNQVVVDSFSTSSFRSATYNIQIKDGTSYHVFDMKVLHDGTTVFMTQYSEIFTGSRLGTVDATISGGNVNLTFQPSNSPSTIKMVRTGITS